MENQKRWLREYTVLYQWTIILLHLLAGRDPVTRLFRYFITYIGSQISDLHGLQIEKGGFGLKEFDKRKQK